GADRQVGAFFSEDLSDRPADPPACSGDQHRGTTQSQLHARLLSSVPVRRLPGRDYPGADRSPDHAPVEWNPPSTCTISPVVAGNQSDSRATTARAAGSGSVMSQPSGARFGHSAASSSKPGM